jgi:hypothetical protein
MRKLLYIALLVLPVFVFGEIDTDGDASEDAEFRFVVPEIVAVQVPEATITWDFGTMAGFPPASFPQYYAPTSPAAAPQQTISYLVWGLGNGTTDWALTVAGGGDPGNGILLGDIEHSPDGSSWDDFNLPAAADTLDSGNTSTGGWQTLDQYYQVNITGDETYTGGSSCTITYTIQTL